MEEKEEQEEVKVVDKRRFTEDSEHEEVSQSSPQEKESVKAHNPVESLQESKDENLGEAHSQQAPQKIDFSSFLFGLYTQALMFLGEVPNPQTNQIQEDLEAAKHNVDLLGILEDKTKGNLTEQEEGVLTEILNNLRLLYVKKKKQ